MVDAWFNDAVIDGLTMLVPLSLPGTPAAEAVPLTAQAWINTLWDHGRWDQEPDMPRLQAGFVRLARTHDRWPAPRHLLEAMPPRREVRALPPPQLSKEQLAANRARIAALIESLKGTKT